MPLKVLTVPAEHAEKVWKFAAKLQQEQSDVAGRSRGLRGGVMPGVLSGPGTNVVLTPNDRGQVSED